MAVAMAQLSEELQTLIDARLDTIDRMLLGHVPRADRLAIVHEVEGQIHDLLAGRGADEPGRDDVLAVLARLDPPEAYLPEGSATGPAVARVAASTSPRPAAPAAGPGIARASGILGIVALGLSLLMPLVFVIGEFLETLTLFYVGFFGVATLSLFSAVLAVTLATVARLRGAWAIVGLVTGLLAGLFATAGGVGVLFLL